MKQTFNIWYSETKKQLIVLLGLPLFIAAIIIFSILSIETLTDTALLIIIFGGMALLFTASVFSGLYLLQVPAEITMDEKGFTIRILKGNPLYPNTEWNCPWSNIENAAPFEYNNRFSFRFKYRKPKGEFLLFHKGEAGLEANPEFWQAIHQNITNYNDIITETGIEITQKGFYKGTFANVIAYLIIAMIIGIPLLILFSGAEDKGSLFGRFATILIFGIPYLIAWGKSKSKK